jgi:pimeloyl-ACP methyl ester carboxylesterase
MKERAVWRDPALGPPRELETPNATIKVHERGSGEPIVLIHGLLSNANLWRKLVPLLAPDFRVITLDLPLGAHTIPAPRVQMDLAGMAGVIADALEALELEAATVVANDTGGAVTQALVTTRPERIGRLVLTSCDCFDNYLPPTFMPLVKMAAIPGALLEIATMLRLRPARRLPMAFGWLSKSVPEAAVTDTYVLPMATDKAIRSDVKRFLKGVDKRLTVELAEKLPGFDRPTLIAWSREDRFFKPEHAEKLAALFPDSRLEWIEDAYTFSMEDQPERLAELVGAFVREPAGVGAAS